MNIKAIIFDMDGVLIDAKEWHYESLNKALGLFGYTINRYEHLTMFDGLPTKKKLDMLSVISNLPPHLHTFINELKQKYTMDIVYTSCKPTFIHEYALSKLKYQGFHLAVASNSIRKTVEVMMERARLDSYLDFILSNEDVNMAKPDPEIYQKAIAAFNLRPNECLIVEDNPNGIKAAQASGANVMIVKDVFDVTYENIIAHIHHLQQT